MFSWLLKVFFHVLGGKSFRYALKPLNIPLAFLPYFRLDDYAEKFFVLEKLRSKEHLFGMLQQRGFHVITPSGSEDTYAKQVRRHTVDEREVLFLQYGSLDRFGHAHGPDSTEVRQRLRKIDDSIAEVYDLLADRMEFVAIFGDHSMVEVQESVDLWKHLMKLRAKPVRDYLVFLNSPLARFWFKGDEVRREVMECLLHLERYGKVVSAHELTEWNIPIDRRYGEVIFWLRRGFHLCPDFYHTSTLKGLHHYVDDLMETPMIVFHRNRELKLAAEARTVDVVPTVLSLLGIDPIGMDGRSLVDAK